MLLPYMAMAICLISIADAAVLGKPKHKSTTSDVAEVLDAATQHQSHSSTVHVASSASRAATSTAVAKSHSAKSSKAHKTSEATKEHKHNTETWDGHVVHDVGIMHAETHTSRVAHPTFASTVHVTSYIPRAATSTSVAKSHSATASKSHKTSGAQKTSDADKTSETHKEHKHNSETWDGHVVHDVGAIGGKTRTQRVAHPTFASTVHITSYIPRVTPTPIAEPLGARAVEALSRTAHVTAVADPTETQRCYLCEFMASQSAWRSEHEAKPSDSPGPLNAAGPEAINEAKPKTMHEAHKMEKARKKEEALAHDENEANDKEEASTILPRKGPVGPHNDKEDGQVQKMLKAIWGLNNQDQQNPQIDAQQYNTAWEKWSKLYGIDGQVEERDLDESEGDSVSDLCPARRWRKLTLILQELVRRKMVPWFKLPKKQKEIAYYEYVVPNWEENGGRDGLPLPDMNDKIWVSYSPLLWY
jgi:hypothetical protein